MSGMWEILCQSSPLSFLHRLSRCGHFIITNLLSAVRFCSSSGIDIRLEQPRIIKNESDLRLPICFVREDMPSQNRTCKERRVVRCWIPSGNEVNFKQPICKSSSAVKYWIPSDKELNLRQLKISNVRSEDKPCKPFIGKDKRLLQFLMRNSCKECRFWSPSGRLSSL